MALRERFGEKQAQKEQQRTEEIRSQLAEIEAKKGMLEKQREELLKGREEITSAVASEREQRKELRELIAEHAEVLKEEGIEDLPKLVESEEYKGEPEIQEYRTRRAATHEKVEKLKGKKKEIQTVAGEEVGVSRSELGVERPRTLSQKQAVAFLDRQIAELDREYRELWMQTPEGKEAREKEKQELAEEIHKRLERRQSQVLFQKQEDLTIRKDSFFSQEMFARAQELGDVEKHDEALVKEAIREAEKRIIARDVGHLESVLRGEGKTRYGNELARLRKQAEDLLPAHIDRDWAEVKQRQFEEKHQEVIRRGGGLEWQKNDAQAMLAHLPASREECREILDEIVSFIVEHSIIKARPSRLEEQHLKLAQEERKLHEDLRKKQEAVRKKEEEGEPRWFGGKYTRELKTLQDEETELERKRKEKGIEVDELQGKIRRLEIVMGKPVVQHYLQRALEFRGKSFTVGGMFQQMEQVARGHMEEALSPEDREICDRNRHLNAEQERTKRRYEEAVEALQAAQAR